MTGWAQARQIAYEAGRPLPPVEVPLSEAAGCVLAEALWSLVPLPPFDTAAMDGWAVRGPGGWRVRGRVLAGAPAAAPLQDGEAVEVATGAQVPAGTDAVLPYEHGVLAGDELVGEVVPGRHVRRTGEECSARSAVLGSRTLLTPAAIGLAAALGHDVLRVHPKPRVAALVTGDELLRSGLPGDGRIRDAVGPLLSAALDLVALDHLGDDADLLAKAVADAEADVVVTTGASSVGRADFLPVVLHALDARLLVDGVDVKPGHPQTLARLPDGRLLVGLPGNPLAALAGVVTVLTPLLAGLSGRPLPALSPGRLTEPLAGAGWTRLVPVAVHGGLARPTGHGGSAMLRGAAVADAFAVVTRDLAAGDEVELAAF
ncbi:MAG: molybdopterin molybdotransferase MoeA [Actinobacteria bacterium]|nr:molybdopterin molybdotransferase MoeA [Actinomycetota bacterium]